MGDQNSSLTRAAPVFSRLLRRDPTGHSWLPALIRLPSLWDPSLAALARAQLPHTLGPIRDCGWGRREKGLAPPPALLDWLVRHATLPHDPQKRERALRTGETRRKREALARRDPVTTREAEDALRTWRAQSAPGALPPKAWYVLEGATRPDAYLATPEAVVVVEGKRTERGATVETTWMGRRDQLLRHVDAAWETRGARTVLGLLIVEGNGGPEGVSVPSAWYGFAERTISRTALRDSLPHRTEDERVAIAACVLGVTTWQSVCAALGVPFSSLPYTADACPPEDAIPPALTPFC